MTWLAINWELIPARLREPLFRWIGTRNCKGTSESKIMSDASGLLSHSAHGSFITSPAILVDVHEYAVFQRLFACIWCAWLGRPFVPVAGAPRPEIWACYIDVIVKCWIFVRIATLSCTLPARVSQTRAPSACVLAQWDRGMEASDTQTAHALCICSLDMGRSGVWTCETCLVHAAHALLVSMSRDFPTGCGVATGTGGPRAGTGGAWDAVVLLLTFIRHGIGLICVACTAALCVWGPGHCVPLATGANFVGGGRRRRQAVRVRVGHGMQSCSFQHSFGMVLVAFAFHALRWCACGGQGIACRLPQPRIRRRGSGRHRPARSGRMRVRTRMGFGRILATIHWRWNWYHSRCSHISSERVGVRARP